jgi:two-component system LytT family response regulator
MTAGRHRVLLVDDEALGRQRLRQLLSAAPDFDVVGECDDPRKVAEAVRTLRPTVVFLDVRMPRMDGFEARELIAAQVPHIVFVTAHAEHAARAFDVAASDYLVKPVTQARFNAALDRIRRTHDAGGARILLGSRQGGATVEIGEVVWVEADGAYVVVHVGGRNHVLRESLAQILERFGPGRFLRIHRSAGINLDHLRALKRGKTGLAVELSDGTRLPISRRKAREVLAHLGHAGRSDRAEQGATAGSDGD